jgi:hypothetical protein
MISRAQKHHKRFGFGLVEIIVGAAIFTTSIIGLTLIARFTLESSRTYLHSVQAGLLLEEGIEAVKIIRDTGWSANIATQPLATDLYLILSGGTWDLTAAPQPQIDGIFDRTIQINEVRRDSGTDDIVSSGGTIDSDTLSVTIYVSWQDRTAHSETVTAYITNLFND